MAGKKISIIIPAYNEQDRIGRTLHEYSLYSDALKKQQQLADYELVVVMAACTDNTPIVVEQEQKRDNHIHAISLDQTGKGLALITGFTNAISRDTDLIGFTDADRAVTPEQWYALADQVGPTDVVIGSRYMPGSDIGFTRPWYKEWGRRLVYGPMLWLLFGLNLYDLQCGAKIFKRNVLETIVPHCKIMGWACDAELLYLSKKYGFSIAEIPITWRDQPGSKLHPLSDGMKMLYDLVKLRLIHTRLY